MHGIEYWIRQELSLIPKTRSGPIASGKTVGLLDTFLIGSLSVYDLLIIVISMIIIMVSTFVLIYDHWSLSSTPITTQCSLSCQFVVDIFFRNLWLSVFHTMKSQSSKQTDQYSFSTLLKVKDLKKCWPKVLSRTNNKEVRRCQSTTALASVCDRALRNTLKPKEKNICQESAQIQC